MNKVGGCLLMAAGLSAPLARASSPEPPLRAELRPLHANSGSQGRVAVELNVTVKEGKDTNEYTVDVSRPASGSPLGPQAAAPERLAAGAAVNAAKALVVEDALEAGSGPVVHARYQLEVRRADGRYHGFLVLDQAFARGADGSLKAIDFAEEMRLTAGKPPVVLSPDHLAAGGNTPRATK